MRCNQHIATPGKHLHASFLRTVTAPASPRSNRLPAVTSSDKRDPDRRLWLPKGFWRTHVFSTGVDWSTMEDVAEDVAGLLSIFRRVVGPWADLRKTQPEVSI